MKKMISTVCAIVACATTLIAQDTVCRLSGSIPDESFNGKKIYIVNFDNNQPLDSAVIKTENSHSPQRRPAQLCRLHWQSKGVKLHHSFSSRATFPSMKKAKCSDRRSTIKTKQSQPISTAFTTITEKKCANSLVPENRQTR